jgi:hypothetical protein
VHVYATDNNKHLHDFYKPISTNWQDIDLTNQTGAHAIFGMPYAYGGNSIQTVSTTASGDLETFVQGVFSDGTINTSVRPAAFDITQLSGGTEFPFGTSSPVVTGNSTVNIFVDDTHSSRAHQRSRPSHTSPGNSCPPGRSLPTRAHCHPPGRRPAGSSWLRYRPETVACRPGWAVRMSGGAGRQPRRRSG